MTIVALVVLPNPIWVGLLETIRNRLHMAMPTIVIGPVHLAIRARIEMGELLRHSTELARTIFLMMVCRKLVTPRAFAGEYTRRSWRILHVICLDRLDHVVLVRIQTSDQIRCTCRDRVVRENSPLSCVVTRAPFSMPQFGLFHPMLDFRDVSKGEVRQYATATAPIFYPQPTVLEGTLDVIGNLESHAARRVTAISQT